MKYLLTLTSLYLCIFLNSGAQEAVFPVTNFTTKDYGRDFHPTNSAVIQDQRGIIYAANGFKLLEYDGSGWRSYPISRETWILSLAVDSNGIIYAGSQNEFGFFAPDKRGELKYNSLSDSLDPADMDFNNIWKVHSFSGGVVFQAEEKIFIYSQGKISVVKPATTFHTSFVVNDRIFLRQRESGLYELKDNSLRHITGSSIFDTTGIFFMLPYGRNNKDILIGTREKGFWLLNEERPSGAFRKFETEDAELLKKAMINGAVLTGDGSIAIGTSLYGVIVIDTAGNTKAIINAGKGLADNDVKHLITDKEKNLWVALNKGLSRIGISSPLSVLNESSGITGTINCLIRYGKLLYAGTSSGLFIQAPEARPEVTFKQAFGIRVPVRSMIVAEGSLLVGTDEGLYQVYGNTILKLDNDKSFTLLYSPELRLLFSGGQGLGTFRYQGSFLKTDLLRIEEEDIIGISNEDSGLKDSPEFWLGTRYNGVIRIRHNKDLAFTTDKYTNADGLPNGPVIPAVFNSKTVFATIQGLYSFTNENIVKESLPDSLKDNKNFIKGYFALLPDRVKGMDGSVSFLTENKGKVWLCSDNTIGYLDKTDSLNYIGVPFRAIDAGKINTVYPEESGLCWIGTTEGLFRYDEDVPKDYNQTYLTLIRRVALSENDSVLFMGTGFQEGPAILKITAKQTAGQIPSLAYRDNSLRIEYSALFYEYGDKTQYSYKLEGQGSKWSQWSKENFTKFTNLREGNYTFSVKAINIYGKESPEASYSFTILPPWYRSVTAYTIYIIGILFMFWLFARLYTYRLKRENLRLEGIVSERTAEVVRQKDEIIVQNKVLEQQKKEIEDSIRYAQRIQSAVLPSEKVCHELLPESFVFFRPLNIVSGDYYWISRVGNKLIFTVADCTGHGVPGAFMSMLGVAFLNEIVNKDNVTVPDQILNQLRAKVINALQQQGLSGEARDGMDIAIISIDQDTGILEFAGAYNPLVMIRKGVVTEFSGDKMPIGIYENMHEFTRHELVMEKGDAYYMYSDGYEDQFGGPDGKKFKSKKLKNLLLDICNKPVEEQSRILETHFDNWKGELPQVDDVVLAGIIIR